MDRLSSFNDNPLAVVTAVLGGASVAILAANAFKKRAYDVDRVIKPAGGHWLWGHEHAAWEAPDSEWYIRNTEEHGLVFAMKGALFHPDILVVSDPAALHHIYTHSHRFIKSVVVRPHVERFVGRGLVWAEGTEHTRQRQMVAPLFTSVRVKRMNDEVQAATETFIEKSRHLIASDPASSPAHGLRINTMTWVSWPALDIIGKVGLGYDFGCGGSTEADNIRVAAKVLTDVAMGPAGFYGPLALRTFPWISNLPIAIVHSEGVTKTLVKNISRKVLEDAKLAGDDEMRSRNDLLGKLIQATNLENEEDVDMMLDQVSTFILAGHETTTTCLSMTLLHLAQRSDIQTALRKELTESGGSGPSGQLTYDDISDLALPLLDAVTKEGLRMCPVGSHSERMATHDEVIPLRFPLVTKTGETINAIRVQKGQVFYIPSLAINMNTRMWGADGQKFDPYRWIEPGRLPPPSNLTGGVNGHFTFLEGPRQCVAYRLAIFEFKVILSALIKNFEFQTTGERVQTTWASTLQPFVTGQREAGAQLPLFVKPVST